MCSINTTLPAFPSVFRGARISCLREKVGCRNLNQTVPTWGQPHLEHHISLGSFAMFHFLLGEHSQRGIFSSWKYRESKASGVDGACLTPWSCHSHSCSFSPFSTGFFQPRILSAPMGFNQWDQHWEHQGKAQPGFYTAAWGYWAEFVFQICMRKWKSSSQLPVAILLPKSASDWDPSADLLRASWNPKNESRE